MRASATHDPFPAATAAHVAGPQRDVLHCINKPGVNLSLWQRPARAAITAELRSLQASDLADVRRPATPASFDQDISALLRQQGLDPGSFEHLRADLHELAEVFFGLTGGRNAIFRLVATDRDDCRRFHVDRTRLRLLCTYRGPGTEWLAEAQVDRLAQARGAPNDAIIRFGEASRFETFWVGILRGDPENSAQGLVHRSPPVEGTGQTRVLFCMDS